MALANYSPKTKSEVLSVLAKRGITVDQVQARAIQIEGAGLQLLDRLMTSREVGRRNLRKDFERREASNSKVPVASDQPRNVDD